MKFLLLLFLVLLVVGLLRGARRLGGQSPAPPTDDAIPPQEVIVACAHCGLMLPAGEALPGREGVFCSDSHRTAFETRPPAA